MYEHQRVVYPFSAIIGQEKMKLGLIISAINAQLGGILILGAKGTAKSTAVRALATLLPEQTIIKGCPFNCRPEKPESFCAFCRKRLENGKKLEKDWRRMPVIELPVSATEDRVVGGLDFGRAIQNGCPAFEPGLLARAHRGIIYVDEVNLLDHHIVDVLLDAAAMGVNVVEREGVSYAHAAQFTLIGTMNPEEGDLRPQLNDRFGLCVQVEAAQDPAERVSIIRRREQFEADPRGFCARWAVREQRLKERIAASRRMLPEVRMPDLLLSMVARLCLEHEVAGHRADIAMAAAARTIAAWHGRVEVGEPEIYEAAELVLPHRARRFVQRSGMGKEMVHGHKTAGQTDVKTASNEGAGRPRTPPSTDQPGNGEYSKCIENRSLAHDKYNPVNGHEKRRGEVGNGSHPAVLHRMVYNMIQPFLMNHLTGRRDRAMRNGSGRRFWARTSSRTGRYARSTMQRNNADLAFDATLRAAAPYQTRRRRDGVAVNIEETDIREKVREKHTGQLILFVVDASGSMGVRERMVETKGAILALLVDAYQKRDKIGMVIFRGETAEVLLPPTNSVEMGHKLLRDLPVGGTTPLAAGLLKAYELVTVYLRKKPDIAPLLIIVTDGKSNVSMGGAKPLVEALQAAEIISCDQRIKTLVVDVEKNTHVTFGVTRELAWIMGAEFYCLDELKAETLVDAVRRAQSV